MDLIVTGVGAARICRQTGYLQGSLGEHAVIWNVDELEISSLRLYHRSPLGFL